MSQRDALAVVVVHVERQMIHFALLWQSSCELLPRLLRFVLLFGPSGAASSALAILFM